MPFSGDHDVMDPERFKSAMKEVGVHSVEATAVNLRGYSRNGARLAVRGDSHTGMGPAPGDYALNGCS